MSSCSATRCRNWPQFLPKERMFGHKEFCTQNLSGELASSKLGKSSLNLKFFLFKSLFSENVEKLGPRHGPRHDFAKSNSFIQLRRARNWPQFLAKLIWRKLPHAPLFSVQEFLQTNFSEFIEIQKSTQPARRQFYFIKIFKNSCFLVI